MHAGIDVLKPLLAGEQVPSVEKIVIGAVKGDLHDIVKDLVTMMMEGTGFEVVGLGTDVPPELFVEAVGKKKPELLGMSALLATTIRFTIP